jgi:hypothetical protein
MAIAYARLGEDGKRTYAEGVARLGGLLRLEMEKPESD